MVRIPEDVMGARCGGAALGAEQQGQAERLIEHTRERVGGVQGDRCEQRINLLLKEAAGKVALRGAEVLPAQDLDVLFSEGGFDKIVPARRLNLREAVELLAEAVQTFEKA